jgi:hypothetical protein
VSNVQPIQVPNTTGAVRSFGHARLNLNGIDFNGGFMNLKWEIENTGENQYSNNPDPMGFSLGQNKYSASVVLYYDFAMNLIQQIGPGFAMVPLVGFFSFGGDGLPIYTDQLLGIRLSKMALDTSADSNKAITLPIDLKPVKILPLGLDPNLYPLVGSP